MAQCTRCSRSSFSCTLSCSFPQLSCRENRLLCRVLRGFWNSYGTLGFVVCDASVGSYGGGRCFNGRWEKVIAVASEGDKRGGFPVSTTPPSLPRDQAWPEHVRRLIRNNATAAAAAASVSRTPDVPFSANHVTNTIHVSIFFSFFFLSSPDKNAGWACGRKEQIHRH